MLTLSGTARSGSEDRLSLTVLDDAGAVVTVIDRHELNACKASRARDREAIAAALLAIVMRHGAQVERIDSPPTPGYCGAGIDLRFSLHGVGAMIDIDDLHGGQFALISWYNTAHPARNFTSRFCGMVGDLAKPRPHHKATSAPADWYSLAMMLDAGLCLAARGEAFEPFSL